MQDDLNNSQHTTRVIVYLVFRKHFPLFLDIFFMLVFFNKNSISHVKLRTYTSTKTVTYFVITDPL